MANSPKGNSPADQKSPAGVWVQIFRTGTHTDSAGKTGEFTGADLDAMVESFDATKDQYQPVLRIGGHDAGTAPAGGRVTGLRRNGDHLEALFDAAPVVADAIRNKLYNGVSAGIRFGARVGDKVLSRFLDHVAILGHRIPAVKGLNGPDGLSALFGADDDDGDLAVITFASEERDMSEQLIRENAELANKVKELEAQVTQGAADFSAAETAHGESIEKMKADHADELKARDAKIAEFETAQAKAEVEAVVDAAISGGRLAPAVKDATIKAGLALRSAADFSAEDSAFGAWKQALEKAPKALNFEEKAASEGVETEHLSKEDAEFEDGYKAASEFQKRAAGGNE